MTRPDIPVSEACIAALERAARHHNKRLVMIVNKTKDNALFAGIMIGVVLMLLGILAIGLAFRIAAPGTS